MARVVLPGDCVELDPEEEALAVVGTQGLKVRVCMCVCVCIVCVVVVVGGGVSVCGGCGGGRGCMSVLCDGHCPRRLIGPLSFTHTLLHQKRKQVTKIAGLEGMVKLRELTLRSSLIGKMEGLSTLTGNVCVCMEGESVDALPWCAHE